MKSFQKIQYDIVWDMVVGAMALVGSPVARTAVEVEKAMQAVVAEFGATHPDLFAGDGVALLQTVYKNPEVPWDVRVDAAKAAAPFERPKLVAAAVRDVTPANRDPSSRNARIMELLQKGLAGGPIALIEG